MRGYVANLLKAGLSRSQLKSSVPEKLLQQLKDKLKQAKKDWKNKDDK